ncbi:MAG: SRPBCC domain-containing protein [Phycisphaerae bacterium]
MAAVRPAVSAEPLVVEGVIDAPQARVWASWTTAAGLESWIAPHADIDLQIGGKMRVAYDAAATLGDESTIENTILAFEAPRMIAIRATHPPKGFPFPNAIRDTWSVVYFEPVGPRRTRVRVVGLGYGDDEESQRMRGFFAKGNAFTLNKLAEHLAPGSTSRPAFDDGDAFDLMARLVGDEWIFENQLPKGGVFRGRSIIEFGPARRSLLGRGWLGDAHGMSAHQNLIVWREPIAPAAAKAAPSAETTAEPVATETRFTSVDENGGLSSGRIRRVGPDTLDWEWNQRSANGRETAYRVELLLRDSDHYRFRLFLVQPDDREKHLVEVEYRRVQSVPPEYLKLRAAVPTPAPKQAQTAAPPAGDAPR